MFTSPSWFAFAILAAPAAAPTQTAKTGQPAATQPAAQPAAKPAATATAKPGAKPGDAPADAATTAADAEQASVDERLKKAEKLYKSRKYVESARELEGLWDDTKQPNALYNAALARFAAAHFAHTIAYLEAYVADVKDAPQEALELAAFQLEKAKEKSAEVPVVIGPPEAVAAGAEIWVRRIPQGPTDTRPDLTLRVPAPAGATSAKRSIHLDAGRWTIETHSKGFISQPQEIEIGKRTKNADPVNFLLGLDPKLRHVAFRIDVPPGTKVDSVDIELRPSGDSEAEPLTCTVRPFELNECKLLAEVGSWEVSSTAPGFKPFSQVITLTRGQDTAAFTLPMTSDAPVVATPEVPPEPVNTDVVPKRVRMRMAGGLNASGLPIFVTGLGLAVYGSNTYDRVLNSDPADCSSAADALVCQEDTIKAIRLRTAGLALVGTATGLFVTGLTAEFDVKPRVWYAELGTGAALLVGGASWLAATNVGLNRELKANTSAWDVSAANIDRSTNQRLAAAMFMGTGIGLVTGSTVGLLVRKRYAMRNSKLRSARLGPFAPIGGGGFMLSGRF